MTGAAGRRLIGVGLVLVAAGCFLVANAVAATPVAAVQAAPAPVNPGALDPMDISANNSPTMARNPRDGSNLALAHRVDLPRFSCAVHVSFDHGASWSPTPVPQPPGTEPKCYAPDVAFGADGTLFVSYVMLAGIGNTPDSLWVASSTDGGRTLRDPVRVSGPLTFQARIAADPSVPDRLTLTWLQAEATGIFAFPTPGNPIVASLSEDGGDTWSEPVAVSDAARARVLAPAVAIDGEGDLLVAHLDVMDDRLDYHGAHEGFGGPPHRGPWELVLSRSSDGGRSWSETTIDDALVPIERFVVFLPPFPSLAVTGERVHVAFHDARLGDADAWVWSSTDRGATWAEPVRVNDTPAGDGTTQSFPTIAAAPDGRLDVLYYDRRGDPDDILTEVSLQHSFDAGRSFEARVRLSDVAFDARIGFGSERDMADLGSRLGLVSTGEQAVAAWTDTRNGTVDSGKQDIMRASVAITAGDVPATRRVLQGLGVVVGIAGVVTLVRPLRPRRSPGRRSRPGRPRSSVSRSARRGPRGRTPRRG